MGLILVGVASLFVYGCVTTEQLAPPVDEAMLGMSMRGDLDLQQARRGRHIYITACIKCQNPLQGGMQFCPACGASQVPPACGNCGQAIPPGFKFCANCGTPAAG